MSILKTSQVIIDAGLKFFRSATDSYKISRTDASNVVTDEIIIDPTSVRIPRLNVPELDTIGSFKSFRAITTNTILTTADIGTYIAIGATNLTVTLPSSTGLKIGSVVNIFSHGPVTVTSQVFGHKIYTVFNGQSIQTVTLNWSAKFVWRGDMWQAFDEMNNFNVSRTPNGYQILPSGLIMQWGVVQFPTYTVANTFSQISVAYPIPFPTSVFSHTGTLSTGIHSATFTILSNENISNTGFIPVYACGTAGNTPRMHYIAIGH